MSVGTIKQWSDGNSGGITSECNSHLVNHPGSLVYGTLSSQTPSSFPVQIRKTENGILVSVHGKEYCFESMGSFLYEIQRIINELK